jgi:serine/threonine protein kinase
MGRLANVSLGTALARRFELVATLGSGGLGELYSVRDGSGKSLALRQTDFLALPSVLEALAGVVALHHRLASRLLPLARVLACGENNDLAWYSTDLQTGQSLADHVRRQGPVPQAQAIGLIAKAAHTISALHDENVLHQDLNPRNIFVDGDSVSIVELGIGPALAKVLRERPGVLATPSARAPEQFVADADPRTDLYALGALLFYAVTGRKALPDGSSNLRLATAGRVQSPSMQQAPAALRDVLSRVLSMRPDERYPSARAFHAALLECGAA